MGEHIYFQLEHIKTSHFSYSPVLAKRLENNLLVSLTSQEPQQHLPEYRRPRMTGRCETGMTEANAVIIPGLTLIFSARGRVGRKLLTPRDQTDLARLFICTLFL